MTIGRIAERADVTIDTIRFYERRGLLPSPTRTANGYRVYSEQTIERLHFVRRAKELGFTLGEITGLKRMRDTLRELNNQCSGSGSIQNCPIIETLTSNNDTQGQLNPEE